MVLLFSGGVWGQVANYAFNSSSGTYTPITGGTVVRTGSLLDSGGATVTLPTAFPFNGASITSIRVNDDAYLALGVTSFTNSTQPIASSNAATGIIAALACDLMDANAVGTTPEIRWEQIGNEIIFQWNDFARYTSSTSTEIFDFQIRLNTSTGQIIIVYSDFSTVNSTTTYTPQVGLRGSTTTDFNSRRLTSSVPTSTPSWSNTAAATTTGHNVRFTSTSPAAFPSTGLTFTWAPPTPCSGTPTPGTIASNTSQNICSGTTPAVLTVTGTTSGVTGITFQWEQSTDNATWTNASGGTGATTASYTPPSFLGTTIYYRCKVTCTSSSLSDVTNVATIAPPANPTTQTSNVTFTNVNYTSFTASWTNGNGNRRVVYVSDAAITDPTNNSGAAAFTANTTYSGSGQQIVYDGTGASVSVTGLALGTTYNVKVIEYTRCGSGPYDNYFNVSSGTNSSSVTTTAVTAVPWNEGFATTTLPSGWLNTSSLSISSSISELNPALATNYIYTNIYDDGWSSYYPSANFSTPIFATLPSNYRLVFDYKINNYGLTTAPGAGTGNVVVAISTNYGSSFTNLQTINNNGTTGWQNVVIDLSSYAGQNIRLKFTSTISGYQDYYVGFDNFKLEAIPTPTITTVASSVACGATTSTITITGTGLSNATSVKIGGTTISPLASNTDTQITAVVSSAVSGTVEVTTNGGSITSSGSVSFAISPALSLNSATQTNCAGVTNSTLTTVTSTVADYDTFTWSPSTNVSGDATNGWTFNPTSTITYTLTATNSAGCSRTATKTVTVNAVPSAVIISPSTSVVAPGSTTTLIASGGTIGSAGVTTIGTGTLLTGATSQPTAFCNRYDHYWSQTVFTAAELIAAGVQAGNISAIKYNIAAQGSANTVTDFKVRIGTTSNSTLSSFQTSGLTQVFSIATYNINVGVNTITFNTPYVWDGVSNILLDVRQTGIDSTNNTTTYYTTSTGNTVVSAVTSTLSSSDSFAGSNPSATASTNRLNTTFVWDSSVATSTTWSPTTDLYTDSGATVAYTGGAATTVYAKPTATTTYSATSTSTTGCTSIGSTTLKIGNTWTGTTSTSWNTASNWSASAVPTSNDDILINNNSPFEPVMDVDITVPVGKSLIINGSGTLTIAPGKVLTIAGTADFGGKAVTIKSDANGNGAIGQVTGTLSGATNVTVERYIPANRAWRALTAPLKGSNSSIFSQWQNNGTVATGVGIELWHPSGDASPSSSNTGLAIGPNSSILQYTSGAWVGVANTNTTNLFTTSGNNAFMVFPTGGFGSGNITTNTSAAATTLKATGQLISGPVTYSSLSNTNHTLIGNPYASPLDPAAVITSNASLGGNIWVWDANTSGTNNVGCYNLFNNNAYANVTGSLAAGVQIQSGQAFFVKPTANLASFSIQEAHKGTAFSNAVLRNGVPELFRVGLYKQVNNEWAGRDGAMTVILSDAAANQAPNKMANGSENIAFTKNGALFASNHHLPLVATNVLNVKVWNTTAGANYKLKFNTEAFTATNLSATLEDLFTNSRTPLNLEGAAVEYPFTVTTDALSSGDRFRIVFQNAVLGTNNPTTNGFQIVPNPVTGDSFQVNLGTLATGTYSYSICNAIGQEVEKGSIQNATQNTNYTVKFKENAATGIYIMKIKGSDNSVFTAKIIKK